MSDPILYNTFDKLYNAAASIMPKSFQEHPEILAAGLGAAGGYLLTRGIQAGIKKINTPFYDKYLPDIELILTGAVCLTPLIGIWVNPDGLIDLINNHPVYTLGVTAGLLGSSGAAVIDATSKKRSSSTFIDDLAKLSGYDKPKKNK